MNNIDFDFINEKLSKGFRLRIDVGLSISMPHSMEWMNEHDNVFVIGFEPHPFCYKSSVECLKNSNFSDRCYLIEAAVDDVEDPKKDIFYALNGPDTDYNIGTSSLRKPKGKFANSIEATYEVDILSLNYILSNLNYGTIDFLKTDTQGNDLNVLRSLGQHIKNVAYIQSEYDSSGTYEHANTGQELDIFLAENGFEKYEPVLCYYTNDDGVMMYDVADYKYRNLNL